jgi:hypothetical protein
LGDRCAITYNSSRTGWATVRREPELPFYRQIGYDFNPRTFMRHGTIPLAELLERVLKGPATLSTRMDGDGILHLIGEYRSPKQHEHTLISVDPAKGYRLTTYLSSMESLDQPGRSFTEFIEIQWADYGPACYVKTVNRSVYAGIHSWEDKPSLSTSDLLKSIDVSVSEFQPNIEIDDAEFTLQGLRLPQGTEVIDEISGVTYRIGGGDLQTDVLEKPLAQAHFVHKIGNQRPGQDANADGQASSMERTEESAAKTAAARKVGLIIPVALIVLGGVILVLISRHRASFVRKVR